MRVLDENELEKCQISIARDVYERQLSNRDGWLILGDETGGLGEFKGVKLHRPSRMLWIVVPPSTTMQNLHPFYHGQDAEWFENETITAFENLLKNEEVGCFIFTHEEGLSPGPKILKSKVAQKEHLLMWQFTLPLVLEWVSSKISKEEKVTIYVERVDPLVPGEMPLVSIMQEFVEGLKTRESWSKLIFKEHLILAKEPIEHPWLGYTDCLGHIYNEILSEPMRELVEIMKKRVFSHPYRQTSLNGSIRQALKNTARPLVFLKSLSDLSSEDLRDYIQPFFSTAINEALSSLSSGEWQDLLLHMDTHSKSKQGQNATALIHGFVNIDQTLDKLPNNSDKFDFLLAMLGTSNHIGAIAQANQCTNQIELLIEDGFEPRPNRMKKYQNLSGGAKDNVFDFKHIRQLWDIQEESLDIDEETERYLGAQAQSRALRAKGDDFEEAVSIENFLRNLATDNDELNRRYTLHSELLMDQGDYDGARLNLEDKLPKKIKVNAKSLRNGFYLAALLKSCALSGANKSDFAEYSKLVKASFNEYHPSQRIAYWCARWASEIGQVASPVVEQCCNHLIGLMETPLFTHDAAGIILGCELLDLKSRGLVDVDAESFMENVLSNSAETTREWVAAHPPNVEDWLAPLNFNYR